MDRQSSRLFFFFSGAINRDNVSVILFWVGGRLGRVLTRNVRNGEESDGNAKRGARGPGGCYPPYKPVAGGLRYPWAPERDHYNITPTRLLIWRIPPLPQNTLTHPNGGVIFRVRLLRATGVASATTRRFTLVGDS